MAKPLDSFNKFKKILLSSQETFFCRNLENDRISLGRCNAETVSRPGIYGLSCSKVAGFEGGLFQNFSRATFFVFWGSHLVDRVLSYLQITNLEKKCSVDMFLFICQKLFLAWKQDLIDLLLHCTCFLLLTSDLI